MTESNVFHRTSLSTAIGIAPALSLLLLGASACSESASKLQTTGAFEPRQLDPTMDGVEPNEDPAKRPTASAGKLSALDLSPKLVGSDYFGDLCPPDSLVISPATDGSALSLNFAGGLSAQDGAEVTGSCKIRLSLKVPQGSSFGNVYLYGVGYVYSEVGGANLSIDYSFAGQSETQTASKSFSGNSGPFIMYEVMDRLWSPSCDQSLEQVDLMLDVHGSARGETYLGLGAIELGLSYVDGAKFMRCADRSLIQPPPSEADEPCAGPPRHPCASGLECDIFDGPDNYDQLLTGVCARREEKLEPMPEFGPCNGIRQIGCQAGLVCHYNSAAHAAVKAWSPVAQPAQLLGHCTPERGTSGDKCEGYPAIQCVPGHFCSPTERNTCKAWTGDLHSACEDGIAACNEKLVCQSGVCEAATASEGMHCGSAGDLACGPSLVCDHERNECVSRSGKLGSSCLNNLMCGENLFCYGGHCRDSIKGLGGTECRVDEDCLENLFYCSAKNTCLRVAVGTPRAPCETDVDCDRDQHLTCVAGHCARQTLSDDRMAAGESSATGDAVSP